MIAVDNMPLLTPEKKVFKNFMKTVTPHYQLPSRKTITHRRDEKYKTLKKKHRN